MSPRIRSALGTIVALFITVAISAQTPVTTNGGTVNSIPKFTGASSIGNSAIFESGGMVGIGTTSPGGTLHIAGDASTRIILQNTTLGTGANWQVQPNAFFTDQFGIVRYESTGAVGAKSFVVSSAGNVGIGTTTPGQKLDVTGSIRINSSGAGLIFPNGTVQSTAAFGTITGVTAGSGLVGGGTSGNVSLSADSTVARRNTSQTFTGNQTVSGFLEADGGFSSFLGVNNGVTALVPNGVAAWFRNTNGVPGIGTGDLIQGHGVGSTRVFRVDNVGSVFALNGYFTSGVDFAESVRVTGKRSHYEAGDVLIIASNAKERFALSSEPYSTLVAGVYSTKPGVTASPHPVMGLEQLTKEVPLGIVGIIPTKATTENGPIVPGDLLVTSSTPGHVMKGTERDKMLGAVVGKALEPLPAGTGKIQVLVTLQ